ncbi:MAG: leucyl/phenylalanyl-tRNA--protein transferase [Thermoleophilia bacterium]|nr:leucyl/phenylalanyl-tRNA--protein transferase [Thermoleophilia bacterium]
MRHRAHEVLQPRALLAAYAHGAFPMDDPAHPGGPVEFYEADPRAVIPVDGFRTPRSVARAVRRGEYEVRVDTAVREVLEACAVRRRDGTWLSPRLVDAYEALHMAGHCHTVECWRDGRLAGGLFGVALGGLFTSESMFHRAPDAGNVALWATARRLAERDYVLWDIQMATEHTARFGAELVDRGEYLRRLARALAVRRAFAP